MKYIGLTALCTALSMTGLYFYRQHTERLRLLRTLSDFFFSFSQFALMTESDIAGCIRSLKSCSEFSGLNFPSMFDERFFFGCDVKEIWSECISGDKNIQSLDEASKELLLSFRDCFGNIPLNIFCEKCIRYGDRFGLLSQKEEAAWEKNRSLVLSSGVLAAAAAFFILV